MTRLSTETLTGIIRGRSPRATARREIVVTSVPLHTCYEQLMQLRGPREAVLDYAAQLFADDAATTAQPALPLALEEALSEDSGRTLSLLLSCGLHAGIA